MKLTGKRFYTLKLRKLAGSEEGGVYLFVLFACLAIVVLLGLIFNIANVAIIKMSLQGTSDSAVLTGASWIAGGLNTIAFFNKLMAIFMAVITAVILIELALLACNAFYATIFLAAIAATCQSINTSFWLPRVVIKGIPALLDASYAIEDVQDTYRFIFPLIAGLETVDKLNQLGSSNRQASLKNPQFLIYPVIPSADENAEGSEKLILHIKKGEFKDLTKGIEEEVKGVIEGMFEALHIPGGSVAGKAIGWVTGKAVGMVSGGVGELVNKFTRDESTYSGEKEEQTFERKLKKDDNEALKNREEGYSDPGDVCQQKACRRLLEFIRSLENLKSGDGISVSSEPFRYYKITKTETSGKGEAKVSFTFVEEIKLTWKYYHFKWHLSDEDMDGDGNASGDGCRRRWFTGASQGAFTPFKSMEESLEEVKKPYWINLKGASCTDFDYENVKTCDGRDYVTERFILRNAEIQVERYIKVKYPSRLPAPYVLHQDVYENSRIAALAYTMKTREPLIFREIFKKGSPFGTLAISQACVRDFGKNPAQPGEIFFHSTFDERLCPAESAVGDLLGTGKTAQEMKKYLKDYVLLH